MLHMYKYSHGSPSLFLRICRPVAVSFVLTPSVTTYLSLSLCLCPLLLLTTVMHSFPRPLAYTH